METISCLFKKILYVEGSSKSSCCERQDFLGLHTYIGLKYEMFFLYSDYHLVLLTMLFLLLSMVLVVSNLLNDLFIADMLGASALRFCSKFMLN